MAAFWLEIRQGMVLALVLAIGCPGHLPSHAALDVSPLETRFLQRQTGDASGQISQISQSHLDGDGFPQGSRAGGTRGGCHAAPGVFQILLFHQQNEQIISGHPTFFWYLSADSAVPVRFVLVDRQATKTLFEQTFAAPKAGLMQVTLPEHLPELMSGRQYSWSITLICNPSRPAENVFAQGHIQRVSVPANLAQQLSAATSDLERSRLYAQQGFWYDALAAMANAYKANPDNALVREESLSLLERMGQTWVAQKERQQLQLKSF
jgi:hypothetical protein